MPVPFAQQRSEYDCAPTTILNAFSYLFQKRNQIPPLVIKKVYEYCLDGDEMGYGTTRDGMEKLRDWLMSDERMFRERAKRFPISIVLLQKKEVKLEIIEEFIKNGGVVGLTVKHPGRDWHYILAFGISEDKKWLRCFDPYPKTKRANNPGNYEFLEGEQENLRITLLWLNRTDNSSYSMGDIENRDCMLITRVDDD